MDLRLGVDTMVVQSKARAKELLLNALDLMRVMKKLPAGSQKFDKWHSDTKVAIESVFGQNSRESEKFDGAIVKSDRRGPRASQDAYIVSSERAGVILQSMIDEIEKYWPDDDQGQNPFATPKTQKQSITNQVFIIHGRDAGTKNTVARFLESLDLQPVILHEQPDRGRTIIEKFEDYAQVDFAIALFTPDDFGGLEGDDPQSRARQNVVFEFGYFIGKYGREKVRALVKGNIEIPSNYSGVLNIPLDDSDGWKMHLVRELRSAGFDVDANRLL